VLRLHHVSLIIAESTRATLFYQEVLGLQPLARPELGFPGLWFGLGEGQQLHLVELPNPDPSSGRPDHGGRDHHVALQVDELQSYEERLITAGIPFTRSRSGRPAIFCRDPDGNGWELIAVQ
jgi:glyoxylase I family protein